MDQYRNAIRIIMTWHNLEDRETMQIGSSGEERWIFRTASLNGTSKIIALRRYNRYWSDYVKNGSKEQQTRTVTTIVA